MLLDLASNLIIVSVEDVDLDLLNMVRLKSSIAVYYPNYIIFF